MIDLTKLILMSDKQAYKNNNIYTGSFTISGSFNSGSKTVTKTITLPSNVSNADISFRGRANGGFAISTGESRPNSAWFKRGAVYVRADGAGYSNHPMKFYISARISGNKLTISASAYKGWTGNMSTSAETVYYRVVDYSSF